jgi:hypothetical protein
MDAVAAVKAKTESAKPAGLLPVTGGWRVVASGTATPNSRHTTNGKTHPRPSWMKDQLGVLSQV